MRKLLLAVAVILGYAVAAQATCDHRTQTCFTSVDVSGALSAGSLSTTGNQAVTGNQTVTGTLSVTGASTLTGTVTASRGVTTSTGTFVNATNAVTVSSATTSSGHLYLAGAFASLPTTGFSAGALCILTSDKALYVSTETVVGTYSWIKVGSQ